MFNQIKALLQDAELKQQLKEATTPAEAVKLVFEASAKQGQHFTHETIAQMLFQAQSNDHTLVELAEEDLHAVAAATMVTGPSGFEGCSTYTFKCKTK